MPAPGADTALDGPCPHPAPAPPRMERARIWPHTASDGPRPHRPGRTMSASSADTAPRGPPPHPRSAQRLLQPPGQRTTWPPLVWFAGAPLPLFLTPRFSRASALPSPAALPPKRRRHLWRLSTSCCCPGRAVRVSAFSSVKRFSVQTLGRLSCHPERRVAVRAGLALRPEKPRCRPPRLLPPGPSRNCCFQTRCPAALGFCSGPLPPDPGTLGPSASLHGVRLSLRAS